MGSVGPVGPVASTSSAVPVVEKSRRGRKQNDSLPPSRSRDVQRAFRARRAQRLAWLEARVVELETENTDLRQRLGLPEPVRPQPPPASSGEQKKRNAGSPEAAAPPVATSTPNTLPSPLQLPLPPMTRPNPAHWMPAPAPLFLPQTVSQSLAQPAGTRSTLSAGSPSMTESCDISDEDEHSRLLEFCEAIAGEDCCDIARLAAHSRSSRPVPNDHVPCRVAWSILAPFSSPNCGQDMSATAPYSSAAQLGSAIRHLANQQVGSSSFVRIEDDRILVSIAAIEQVVAQCRSVLSQHRPQPLAPYSPSQHLAYQQHFASAGYPGPQSATSMYPPHLPSAGAQRADQATVGQQDGFAENESGELAGFFATLHGFEPS